MTIEISIGFSWKQLLIGSYIFRTNIFSDVLIFPPFDERSLVSLTVLSSAILPICRFYIIFPSLVHWFTSTVPYPVLFLLLLTVFYVSVTLVTLLTNNDYSFVYPRFCFILLGVYSTLRCSLYIPLAALMVFSILPICISLVPLSQCLSFWVFFIFRHHSKVIVIPSYFVIFSCLTSFIISSNRFIVILSIYSCDIKFSFGHNETIMEYFNFSHLHFNWILWRFVQLKPIKVYRLLTDSYDMKPSLYSQNYVKTIAE